MAKTKSGPKLRFVPFLQYEKRTHMVAAAKYPISGADVEHYLYSLALKATEKKVSGLNILVVTGGHGDELGKFAGNIVGYTPTTPKTIKKKDKELKGFIELQFLLEDNATIKKLTQCTDSFKITTVLGNQLDQSTYAQLVSKGTLLQYPNAQTIEGGINKNTVKAISENTKTKPETVQYDIVVLAYCYSAFAVEDGAIY